MAKRFTETTIWDEDWFLELPIQYLLLYQFIKDRCDHAGIWKPNKKRIETLTKKKIDFDEAIELFNKDKERVVVLKNGRWLLLDFFSYQYGSVLNLNNRVHKSIFSLYKENGVKLESIRGLSEVKQGVKDKDMDKEKESIALTEEAEQFTFPVKDYDQPSLEKVIFYFTEQGLPKEDAENFHSRYKGMGWEIQGYPIKDWTAMVIGWMNRKKQFNQGQDNGTNRKISERPKGSFDAGKYAGELATVRKI